jgi:tetratricopeptide (TPR) repeat protein
MLQAMGENARAEEALRHAIELGQDDPDVRYVLGLTQVGLRDWPEAREIFERVVADAPDKADAWVELALAWRKLGDLERAEAAIARAESLGTASPKLLDNVRESVAGARRKRAAGAAATDDAREGSER